MKKGLFRAAGAVLAAVERDSGVAGTVAAAGVELGAGEGNGAGLEQAANREEAATNKANVKRMAGN